MYFRMLHDEATGELTYLLADLVAREAVLIDPHGRDLTMLEALLAERELRLKWVLRTHHHDGLMPREFVTLGQLGVPVVQGDASLRNRPVEDDDFLTFGNEVVRLLVTPGHTRSCLSFAWRDRLFFGGLLSSQVCPYQPRPAVPDALWDSVTQRVFTLPNETLLFAGHEQRARAVSTVLEQKRWHPWFAALTRDEFLTHMQALAETPPIH